MFMLDSLQKAMVVTFLVASMASIGMQVTTAELHAQVTRRGLRWRTLLANFVIVPALGLLLAGRFVDDPATARAFALLACLPGGMGALQFTTKAKGVAAYAGGTACLLSLLSVILSPFILALTLPAGDSAGGTLAWAWRAAVTFISTPAVLGQALVFLLVFLVVPVFAGMAVRAKAGPAATKLARALGLISVLLFVALMVMLMGPRKEAIRQIGGGVVGLLMVLVLLAMLVGWLLGGPETATRQVLASATSMRNVALALALAVTFPDAESVLPVLIAFSALMVPPNLLLTVACLVANRRRERRQPSPPSAIAAGSTPATGGPRAP